jgi:O-antigen/teichoic acid export membrane protein
MPSLKSAFFTVYLGYIFRYACLIVLIPFYARVLGPAEYGQVLVATALGNFVWAIQNWGFAVVGARNIAASQSANDKQREFSRHLTARLLILPLSCLAGALGTWWSPVLRDAPWLGVLATLWGIASGCNLGWYFQGIQAFRTSIVAEVLNFGFTLLFALLLVTWRAEALMALVALVCANLLSLAYAYAQARATVLLIAAPVAEGLALIRSSLAMFVNAGMGALVANGGAYALGLMSSPAQVAFYGTAERIVTTVLGLLVPAGQVLLPRFAQLHAAHGSGSNHLVQQQRKAIMVVTGVGFAASIGAFVLAPWVLPVFLGGKFADAVQVLQCFSPLFMLTAFNSSIAMYVLLPQHKDQWLTAVGVVSALLNLGSMFSVAGQHGAVGVALGRVGVECLVMGIFLVMARRLFGADHGPGKFSQGQ